MKMKLTWRDQRLEFQNLRNDSFENMVSMTEREKMWIPEIGFGNAKTGTLSKDPHVGIMVHLENNSLKADFSRNREELIFSGAENSIEYNRR